MGEGEKDKFSVVTDSKWHSAKNADVHTPLNAIGTKIKVNGCFVTIQRLKM